MFHSNGDEERREPGAPLLSDWDVSVSLELEPLPQEAWEILPVDLKLDGEQTGGLPGH